jgi:hypothetical protein
MYPSRACCDLLLSLVDLDVPLPPDLGRGEHAAGSAHVTEGSLAGTVGTTAGDTGNTGNRTTCNPPRLAILPENPMLFLGLHQPPSRILIPKSLRPYPLLVSNRQIARCHSPVPHDSAEVW